MVSRIAWIVLVGLPLYFLIYLGLVGLGFFPDYFNVSQYAPSSIETSMLFLAFGSIGTAGLIWHYSMRSMAHGKHCEMTSFAELGLVALLIYVVIQFSVFMERPPFGTAEDFYTLIILSLIAGTMGVILYRIDAGKSLIPKL